jgi:hypothetical protein
MGFISDTSKKIVFWNYSRTSWQWDVLCVLILVFIFLTPKSWFANASYQQKGGPTTVVLSAEVLGTQADRPQVEERARQAAQRPQGRVMQIREVRDSSGKITSYEVDIQ